MKFSKESNIKLIFILSVCVFLFSAWDYSFLLPLKNLIVLIHESLHAIAAIISGGKVNYISLHQAETGLTNANPGDIRGSFIFIVSAGYLGSSLLGGVLLSQGIIEKFTRLSLLVLGVLLAILSYNYTSTDNLAFSSGILWGSFFIIIASVSKKLSNMLLIFLGTGLALYSIHDIKDFFYQIHSSDAGMLACYILNSPCSIPSEHILKLSYVIAGIWSVTGIVVIYTMAWYSLRYNSKLKELKGMHQSILEGKVAPDVAEWFLKNGIDLNGRPLSKELLDEIKKVETYNL